MVFGRPTFRAVGRESMVCREWLARLNAGETARSAVPHVFTLLLILAVTAFQAPFARQADDAFHEGEYTMFAVGAAKLPGAGPPVLIHGGIDVIPARIAQAVCAPDRQIVCVRLINASLTAAAEGLFLTILVMITGLGTIRSVTASLPAICLLIVYNGCARNAVLLQQGTPSVRDLTVLAALLFVFALTRVTGSGARAALAAAAGFVTGFGLFWTYNRGLAAVALTGVATAGLSLSWRAPRVVASAAAGGVAGLILARLSGLYGGLEDNIGNILYWGKNSEIWAGEWVAGIWRVILPAALVYVGLLAWATIRIVRDVRQSTPGRSVLIMLLAGLMLLYAAQSTNRIDETHLSWILWPATLLAAALLSGPSRSAKRAEPKARAGRLPGQSLWAVAAASLVLCTGIATYHARYLPPDIGAWARRLTGNARLLTGPFPRDQDLVVDGLRQAAGLIRARGGSCTYSLSNEGLLYVIAGVPSCSRFYYPIYVSVEAQEAVVAELERHDPPVILVRSPFWTSAIDGRDLAARTPAIDAWVRTRYPYHAVLADGYEIAAREPVSPGGK